MSEWDRKFERMVAETERHLASVKSQLRSPPSLKCSPRRNNYTNCRVGVTTSSSSTKRLSPTGILKSSSSPGIPPSPVPMRNVTFDCTPGHSSSNNSVLLAEKVNSQHKDIIGLRESLNGMQFYMKQQHNQIMALKEEVHKLRLKMVEREPTLVKLRREVRSELDSLKEKIASTSGCVGGYVGGHVTSKDVSSSAISGDMFRSKLQRSDVITSLQRELADVKSILATHDIKVGGVTNELREVKVQQDIVSQEVRNVKEWDSAKMGLVGEQSKQFLKLSNLLSSLECRLDSIEHATTRTSTPTQSLTKRHAHLNIPVHSYSSPMTMSDLNVPTIGCITTATKPLPLHTAKVGINPLHQSSPRVLFRGKGKGKFVAEDFLLESEAGKMAGLGEDEGSDLDDHTLSCGVELMSDFSVSDDLNSDLSNLNCDLLSDTDNTDDTISLSYQT